VLFGRAANGTSPPIVTRRSSRSSTGKAKRGQPPRHRNVLSVTAACVAVRRAVFEELGGFDEELPIAFNDIDLCLRLRERGYRNIFTPHAELVHRESMSRGLSGYSQDVARFLEIWGDVVRSDDPFYSPNLGRFDPWCPLRQPGENERFTALIDRLIPACP